jgi:hypothetical protein
MADDVNGTVADFQAHAKKMAAEPGPTPVVPSVESLAAP